MPVAIPGERKGAESPLVWRILRRAHRRAEAHTAEARQKVPLREMICLNARAQFRSGPRIIAFAEVGPAIDTVEAQEACGNDQYC